MHRACTRLRQRNPNLFIVESLFANNEQGAWYDPSDLNTLFQDDAGTVPVTASGQTVGRMLDKSGRGNHATQSTAGSRPTFRDVGGLRYLEFDGANDFLSTASIDFTVTDAVSIFTGVHRITGNAVTIAETSTNADTTNGTFRIGAFSTNQASIFSSRGTIIRVANLGMFTPPASYVQFAEADISQDLARSRANGGEFFSGVGDQGTGNYTNQQLFIGCRGGASLFFTGHLYGLIVRGALTDASFISSAERYLAAKTGVTLA